MNESPKLSKWRVVVIVDASVHIEVEAASAEEAKEKAMVLVAPPSLCWSCSKHVQMGDPLDAVEAVNVDEEEASHE